MLMSFKRGQGSIVLRVKLRDSTVSTGAGKTALTSSSSGLIISTIADNEATTTAYTQAGSTIESITTLGTYAAPTATKCRFKEVDSTNHKGIYEIQIADARFAVSNAKSLLVSISGVTGLAECDVTIPLVDLDPYAASTPQTGDSYARLGAPAGASVSADVAAIKSDTGTILTDVNTGGGAIYSRLGAPTGASLAADIAAIPAASKTSVLAGVVGHGSLTLAQHLIVIAAAVAGKTSGQGTGTPVFRDIDDTTNVISGNLDGSKNRIASTITP